MAGETDFKVDTTGKPYGVKIWRSDAAAKQITLDFEKDESKKTLTPGDYYVSIVFWGNKNSTLKLTITDPSGKTKTFPPVKMDPDKGFGHNMGRFSIPL